ncbi:Cullin-domain-containing protein [Basidiobolus meristosporus CBS 931.73]|uniref:Cullin-5 n=1 Tax=Basidiobolus meristosporus CBS 931.73 TaxID=1314790 RepID=A0A1Y1YM09_9FUNG|nr:Cullin-domain-containing protein [Basidiobolus meristosporus CBS 931.73]|eukprot:ORX99041.1 Cullin-domain-containing protein [Basidiobolus meristosporus CBS 931.73]
MEEYCQNIWNQIRDSIDIIYYKRGSGLTYERYVHLYTVLYRGMTEAYQYSRSWGLKDEKARQQIRRIIFGKLDEYLRRYLTIVKEDVVQDSWEVLLQQYQKQWSHYIFSSTVLHHTFSWLNQWGEETDSDTVSSAYELALLCFKDSIFVHVEHRMTTTVLKLIEHQRSHRTGSIGMIKAIVDLYVSLGMNVYEQYIESPVLIAAEIYFTMKSRKYLSDNNTIKYMKRVDARLRKEELYVPLYLPLSTQKLLVTACEDALVREHREIIWDAFQGLLDRHSRAEMLLMYSLLSRTPDGLKPIQSQFESHVKRAGFDAIQSISGGETVEPKIFVDTLLELHMKYNDLVINAFRRDVGFAAALDIAFHEIMNRNVICQTSAFKSQELVVRYCDSLLRKNARNVEDTDLENLPSKIMIAFKYVEDKDVFQKFYSKMLAKRLVNSTSASDDAEASMISKLKEACGYEYTSKLQRMFTDMGVSKDLNDAFREKMLETHEANELTDFYILVLGTAAWPLSPPSTPFNIPDEVGRMKLLLW